MHALGVVSDRLSRLVNAIGQTVAWLSLPLAGLILFDIITRRFLVLGSTKLQEMEWHLHTLLFLLCLGYGYLKGAHVRIDLVRERLGERAKAWIEVFGCVAFLIPYCAMIVYFASNFVFRSWELGEVSAATTGLPFRWAIKAAILAGFLVLGLAGVSVLLNRIVFLFGGDGRRGGASDLRAD